LVVLVAATALAQPAEPAQPAQPAEPEPPREEAWARGVAPAERTQALALFTRGNEHFVTKSYREAVELYRQALGHWGHPRIHGNLAIALIQLGQPLKALEHVEAALAHGPDPFDPKIHRQLELHRKLLSMQVGRVKVICTEVGAQVTLDGENLVECPGEAVKTVRVGWHQVVASKRGFVSFVHKAVIESGAEVAVAVDLVALEDSVRFERRWATWKPWAVAAGGVALVGLGIPFALAAEQNARDYDRAFAQACPSGCAMGDESRLSDAERSLVGRVRWQNRIALSAFVVGGAAAVSGAVLVYLNRPRAFDRTRERQPLGLVPVVSPTGAGLAWTMSY